MSGEIWVTGANITRGYINEPELTTKVYKDVDPFYRTKYFGSGKNYRLFQTGDYGYRLANGRIQFIGRKDDQIKINGFRVELGEISSAISEIVPYGRVQVIFHSNRIYAFVTPDTVDPQYIKSILERQLPEYAVPFQIIALSELPLTERNKVDKKELIRRLLNPGINCEVQNDSNEEVAQNYGGYTDIVKYIIKCLREQQIESKSLTGDSVPHELGLDSLGKVELRNKLSKQYNSEIDLAMFYESDTTTILDYAKSITEKYLSPINTLVNPDASAGVSYLSRSVMFFKQRQNDQDYCKIVLSSLVSMSQTIGFSAIYLLGYSLIWFLLIIPFYFAVCLVNVVASTTISISAVLFIIPAVYILYLLCLLVISVVCKWFVIGAYTEGRWPIASFYYIRWWFVDRLLYSTSKITKTFYPFYALTSIWYKCLGMNFDLPSSRIYSPDLREFDLISIGKDSCIEYGVSITASVIENQYLICRRIEIGKNVHIEGKSYICAGAQIADDCIIQPGVCVDGRTPLKSSGVYGFNPPRLLNVKKVETVQSDFTISDINYQTPLISKIKNAAPISSVFFFIDTIQALFCSYVSSLIIVISSFVR